MTEYYFHHRLMPLMPWPLNLSGLMDRNEILIQNPRLKIIRPLGKITNIKSITDLCMERAKDLVEIAKTQDKKLFLFWSGGIDSTAAFLAIRETIDSKKLVIVCNKDSIAEYPEFYYSNIEGKYETAPISMLATWEAVENACTKGIAVTGEIGDQIFGSVQYENYTKKRLTLPWQDILRLEEPAPGMVEQFEPFVAACPQKIVTTAAFYWWLNYSLKYQLVQCRMLLNNKVAVVDQNLYHFYDSADFNDYAVSLPIEEKIPDGDHLKYKLPLKQFILDQTKDLNYFKNKPKVRSLVPKHGPLTANRIAQAIRSDWTREYL